MAEFRDCIGGPCMVMDRDGVIWMVSRDSHFFCAAWSFGVVWESSSLTKHKNSKVILLALAVYTTTPLSCF